MLPTPSAPSSRLASLFSAITSAMQPARLPLALFVVLLFSALVPLIDLAGGSKYTARGFAGGELSATERELDYERARAAVRRFAAPELAAIEGTADAAADTGAGAGNSAVGVATLGDLASAVRQATARKVSEIDVASEGASRDFRNGEVRRIRQAAAGVMREINDAGQRGVATVFLERERRALRQVAQSIPKLDLEGFAGGLSEAVLAAPAAAIRAEPVVFPLALIALLSVVTVCAGGLCRMAAVHAGRASRLTVFEGSGFARARVLNLASLPVLPLGVFTLLAIVVLVFVLLLRVPVLNVVSGLLFVVPLLVALLGAVLAVVVVAGFPLMPAAVAVEDCDAGEAITRASSMVLSRPLLWVITLVVAFVALAAGTTLVAGILALASSALEAMLSLAGGQAGAVLASGDAALIATLDGPDRLLAGLVGFWTGLFQALGAAYACSLACDLAARAYLLMRERIDGESPSTVSGYGIG